MNIEGLKASMMKNAIGLFSNLTVTVPVPKNIDSKEGKDTKALFDDSMAEISQFLVFEEIFKYNNKITYGNLEDKVYDRYDEILKRYNSNFIFSLRMPFHEWIKLQVELGNIILKTDDIESTMSISKTIQELLNSKLNYIYEMTGEKYTTRAVS